MFSCCLQLRYVDITNSNSHVDEWLSQRTRIFIAHPFKSLYREVSYAVFSFKNEQKKSENKQTNKQTNERMNERTNIIWYKDVFVNQQKCLVILQTTYRKMS